ncbi:MAG TPA: hypothetical protein VKB52_05795 [Rhodanobacteraceae bacterium]|nr:hypothetical protein [Rhodanobacteraceae bacterium]
MTAVRRARWTTASALVIALFVAGQALLWLAYYGGGAKRLIGDEESYQAFALAILGGGPWMPSTIWPPLQSLFLAAIYATFGVHVLAAELVQTLLFVGCAWLLRGIWRDLGGGVRAANMAAALFAARTLPPVPRQIARSSTAQPTKSAHCTTCTATTCTPATA